MNEALKSDVRLRAEDRCEYCPIPQSSDFMDFEFDHIIAQKHKGRTISENLALACYHCNSHKGPNLAGFDTATRRVVRLFNPRKDRWKSHFDWDGPIMVARTSIGRVTLYVLNINDPEMIDLREMMIDDGRHL